MPCINWYELASYNHVSFLYSTEMTSSDSDYRSRNPDTATTEVYSDPGRLDLSESCDSIDSLERNFLMNFACVLCGGAPSYDQAVQVAGAWAAGEVPGLASWVLQPNGGNLHMKRVVAFCAICNSFFHGGCILASGSVYAISQLAKLMLMKLEGHTPVAFLCQNCHNNV